MTEELTIKAAKELARKKAIRDFQKVWQGLPYIRGTTKVIRVPIDNCVVLIPVTQVDYDLINEEEFNTSIQYLISIIRGNFK